MAIEALKMDSQHASAISNSHSFSRTLLSRHAEYTRPQKIKVKIGSWNVAAHPGTENDLRSWFVQDKEVYDFAMESDLQKFNCRDPVLIQKGENENIEKLCTDEFYEVKEPGKDVEIYVLGLQEVVGLNSAKNYIGKIYTDTEPVTRWRTALVEALPSGYVQIVEQQLSGLLLFIFASPSMASKISSVSTVTVGTGIMGYLGNKGAIVTRMVLGETTGIVFVNSHLSSGTDHHSLERRYWDVTQIIQKTSFDPIHSTEFLRSSLKHIGDEDFAFWFGDLNFRLNGLPGDEIRRLLMLLTKGEYNVELNSTHMIDHELGEDDTFIIRSDSDDDDENECIPVSRMGVEDKKREIPLSPSILESDEFVLNPSQDPTSLQSTLNCLLPHDELKRAQLNNKVFHDGWREGPISFLPTYKYDIGGDGAFDSSERKRAPSWCDRILYRTRRDKLNFEEQLKKKKEKLAQTGNEEILTRETNATEDDGVYSYKYDSEDDGNSKNDSDLFDESEDEGPNDSRVGEEKINLDIYTSHQQVLSSDHKPVHATFTLSYDVILPELKSKIQQEVARDLDRAENEGRPGVTVVIDFSPSHSSTNFSQGTTDAVDFGDVVYGHTITRHLTVANTSRVPAVVAFIDRLGIVGDCDASAPSWLSVYFVDPESNKEESALKIIKSNVTLEPGDAITAILELHVKDVELVRALNEDTLKLDDVLVLRVIDGRDHFIPIRGSWVQTCLGRSIEQLVRIPEGGVRAIFPVQEGGLLEITGQDTCCSIPRELLKLTETIQSLMERAIADSSILEDAHIPEDAPGWPFDSKCWIFKDSKQREIYKKTIIEALDAGKNINENFPPETLAIERLEIVSEVLLLFLSYLSDGIITNHLWSTLENAFPNRGNSPEETKAWALDLLSSAPNHNISFVFLTSMLSQVIADLTPVSKTSKRVGGIGIDTVLRRSLSWKIKGPVEDPPDPMLVKREKVERAMTDLFVPVIFRDIVGLKDREKRSVEEKRKTVIQAFLKSTDSRNN